MDGEDGAIRLQKKIRIDRSDCWNLTSSEFLLGVMPAWSVPATTAALRSADRAGPSLRKGVRGVKGLTPQHQTRHSSPSPQHNHNNSLSSPSLMRPASVERHQPRACSPLAAATAYARIPQKPAASARQRHKRSLITPDHSSRLIVCKLRGSSVPIGKTAADACNTRAWSPITSRRFRHIPLSKRQLQLGRSSAIAPYRCCIRSGQCLTTGQLLRPARHCLVPHTSTKPRKHSNGRLPPETHLPSAPRHPHLPPNDADACKGGKVQQTHHQCRGQECPLLHPRAGAPLGHRHPAR